MLLADTGWSIYASRDKSQPQAVLKLGRSIATHGYDNQDPLMQATFIANGPAFKKALTASPFDNIEVYGLLANIYMRKGQFDKAIAIGEKGLAINSNSASYNAIFANVLNFVGGPHEKALALMKKAMRLNPNCPSWYLYFLARTYRNLERYKDAIPVFKKYIGLAPVDYWGYLELSTCYISLNKSKT